MRKRRICFQSAVVLTVLSLLLCSCSGKIYQRSKERYVVGVVTKSSTSEYWMSVNSGMEAAAAEYDMDVIVLSPDSELDMHWQFLRSILIIHQLIWTRSRRRILRQ